MLLPTVLYNQNRKLLQLQVAMAQGHHQTTVVMAAAGTAPLSLHAHND